MIHELTLNAVRRKLYDFDHVPRFINANEITCALGIGARQAGLNLPSLTAGEPVPEALARETPPILSSGQVEEHVKEALRSYFKPDEKVTEDNIITMKLGYESE